MTAGYSGTPLVKKLGLKAGMRVWLDAMPESVRDEIDPAGTGVVELSKTPTNSGAKLDAAHIFVTTRSQLERRIERLRTKIAPAGFIWVSWPKKASKMPTDITEQTIRDIALPTGLVDVKVCAVDAVWSGLKLMIRKSAR